MEKFPHSSAPASEKKEVFHPEAELSEILAQPTHERKKALETWKSKYVTQRMELAGLQADLIQNLRKSPDMSRDDIVTAIAAADTRGRFTETQRKMAETAADMYVETRDTIKSIRTQYPNDADLYEAAFGVRPIGKVIVHEDPLTLDFACANPIDFARITTFSKGKGALFKALLNRVAGNKQAGGALGNRHLLNDLQGHLIAEDLTITKKNPGKTRRHEEQHVFRHLLREARKRVTTVEVLSNMLTRKEHTLQGLIKIGKRGIENNIEDELLARLKTHEFADDIIGKMKGYYHQRFIDRGTESLRENLTAFIETRPKDGSSDAEIEEATRITNMAIDHLNGNEFWRDIFYEMTDGIHAYEKLQDNTDMKSEELAALFAFEPLREWPKLAERLLKAEKEIGSVQV